MRTIFLPGILATLLAGCAASGLTSDSAFNDRLKETARSVTIMDASSTNWCETEKTCKYIGEVYCTNDKNNPDKKCKKEIKLKTLTAGGDTFVAQKRGIVKGNSSLYFDSYYRMYGQIYSCSDRFKDIYNEFVQKNGRAPDLARTSMVSEDYFRQCNLQTKCKSDRDQNCSSIQVDPFALCVKKYNEGDFATNNKAHLIVIKNELFNKMGSYRLFAEHYQCK